MKSIQMVIACLFFSILSFLSCKMLKNVRNSSLKDKSLISVNDVRELEVNQSSSNSSHFLEWRLDSSNTIEMVTIWPKGVFTFSALKGFEGEAERVYLRSAGEHHQTGLKLHDSVSSQVVKVKQEDRHLQTKSQVSKATSKEDAPSFWPIVGIVFISVTGLFAFNYLTKSLKIKSYV